MKHLMKHVAMVAVVVALAVGAYMAYQHYSAKNEDVKVQLFNSYPSDGGSYRQGYNDAMRDCRNN